MGNNAYVLFSTKLKTNTEMDTGVFEYRVYLANEILALSLVNLPGSLELKRRDHFS